MKIIPGSYDIENAKNRPPIASVEGDEMVRAVWVDSQGRRCTTFLTAQRIGELAREQAADPKEEEA